MVRPMRNHLPFQLPLASLAVYWMLATPAVADGPGGPDDSDPHLWLEDLTGEKPMAWVKERNRETEQFLGARPGFNELQKGLLEILDSDERIPGVRNEGEFLYNFWRDARNPRGLWRRTTMTEYLKPSPAWDVVLDLDALAAAEKENWVWGGSRFLRPERTRAFISLSRGGGDAEVVREFDLESRAFLPDGFNLPEAKGGMGWIDRDHVFVQTDFGSGSMTRSGYPRVCKLWKRGTTLSEAVTIFEARDTDMSAGAYHDDTPGFERDFVHRTVAFYNNEVFHRTATGDLRKIETPDSARKWVAREFLFIELRDAWAIGETVHPAGSLLAARFDDFMAGRRDLKAVFTPTPSTSLADCGVTRDHLFLNLLEDVKSRVKIIRLEDPALTPVPLPGLPEFGSVQVSAVDADESNELFIYTSDFVTPTRLLLCDVTGAPRLLKSTPAFFDPAGLKVRQHFATSDDGTRVPYFIVMPSDLPLNGLNPTLLYGYGGFEHSLTPWYHAGNGRFWTTQGGVFVVANIRGGGEYGPAWHQAALKQNRHKAYEDFAAVARDLIARGVTSPRHLGIQGGSNGGLLVGNMITRYPDLFHAAVCQVPLLDMRRYHRLLAGASWMAEYGDPDQPAEWAFLKTFSPYHNLRAGAAYPSVLFTTSTRDDRVHPGHARKMMARMREMGLDAHYYENIEGGHGGAANNTQAAHMQALALQFLRDKLFPPAR